MFMLRYLIACTLCSASLAAIDLPNLQNDPQKWLLSRAPSAEKKHKSTLLFVFARDCGNCHRSHKFINALQKKYAAQVRFIGVHTPEFEREKDRTQLGKYAANMGITYPIYLDDDMQIWRSLRNEYWPAFYLFDSTGRLAAKYIGETHGGDANARAIETTLERLK